MTPSPTAHCDLLVISPHTDDLEIGLGGTVALLAGQGRRVWGLDLTRGEMGTNASVAERWCEAADASAVLDLCGRAQLSLPDGFIDASDREQVGQVVAALRCLRPRWVITAPDPIRHPDHLATPPLVAKALFLARLAAWQPSLSGGEVWSGGEALPEAAATWQTEALFSVCPDDGVPAAIFDISATWDRKRKSLLAYPSQFVRNDERQATMINDPAFLSKIERRARTWGRRAGVAMGEAVCSAAVPVLSDIPESRWV